MTNNKVSKMQSSGISNISGNANLPALVITIMFVCLVLLMKTTLVHAAASVVSQTPSKVAITKKNSRYVLTVNGQPYQVNGAGLGYRDEAWVLALAEAGGNTFRTWSTQNIEQELALASRLDLMVAVGIATGKALNGFDYNDESAVKTQFDRVTKIVDKYKNHPNILAWVIANEPNLYFDEQGKSKAVNPKVYDALADITDYIHSNDPNHPVTFSIAGASEQDIQQIVHHVPNIDFISVQLYGNLDSLTSYIEKAGVDKPFMVTEFGPTGHWELPKTAWGREIEEPSALKADNMARRIRDNILVDSTGKMIGSFVFFWGQKQERTPTWYGMFNESGEQTSRIDALTKIWTGKYPKNRAPRSSSITIDDQFAVQSITLQPAQVVRARVNVTDPDGDAITTNWIIQKEVAIRGEGGSYEKKPDEVPFKILLSNQHADHAEITFSAPAEKGEYRLFSYTYDGENKVGNANIPFIVE